MQPTTTLPEGFIPCGLLELPANQQVTAARRAIELNPNNNPLLRHIWGVIRRRKRPGGLLDKITELLSSHEEHEEDEAPDAQHLAVITTKHWPTEGVRLTVGFLDNAPADLRARIVAHCNAWAKGANVAFVETADAHGAQVRITRERGRGHWSYLGTDILQIPPGNPTMNLDNFTMNTPESEFVRVVRHECGHTLGFPHEHMREDIVNQLDRNKTIAYFKQTQGWSAQQTIQQVLTPLNPAEFTGTPTADELSIMCYQLPGSITKDGQPIPGGTDINAQDYQFAAGVYPKAPGPTPEAKKLVIEYLGTITSITHQ